MDKKHVIFDLDGTLINPSDAICRSINYALEKKGHKAVDHKELHHYIGKHLIDPFRDITGVEDEKYLWEMIQHYRDRYEDVGIKENSLYPGIENMLENLGTDNYIASIKPSHASKMILKEFGIHNYFSGVYGSEVDGTRADKTELLHYIKDLEGLDSAVMVGDRDTDIFAAKSCGFKSIGVTYGYGTKEEIIKSEPDYIVEISTNLEGVLKKIWTS